MEWTKKTEYTSNSKEVFWAGKSSNGQSILWKNFGTGPLTLTEANREYLCQKLLKTNEKKLKQLATKTLVPFSGTIGRSLILHSATTDLSAFEADLTKLTEGKQPKNYAGYTEVRSVFLGKPGDLAVGRMAAWKTAGASVGLEMAVISDLSYYYLSDALLLLAEQHLKKPTPAIEQMVRFLQQYPKAIIRLYVSDKAIQIFLVWLQQLTGLATLNIDANSPEVAEIWNKKRILYPTIAAAQSLDLSHKNTVLEILEAERTKTLLVQKLRLSLPGLPGYTLLRHQKSLVDFTQQLLAAAQLLQSRYRLTRGCLKASDAGDGARITPNIVLEDIEHLKLLAMAAYPYGDDYILESHVDYLTAEVGEQLLQLTPSAHIRAGQLAPGITLQFIQGASWVGNLFVNEQLAPQLNISTKQYHAIRNTITSLLHTFKTKNLNLTIAGIDFAIGKIGGKFGEEIMLGIQDPNISFNGAEFLRVFMAKISEISGWEEGHFHAATWVFVPVTTCTHQALAKTLHTEKQKDSYAMAIAVVPGYWAMIGVAALDYQQLIDRLASLKERLRKWQKD